MKKLLKITEIATLSKSTQFPNHQRYQSQVLKEQIEDVNEDFVNISRPYILYFPINKPSKRVTVGLDQDGPGPTGSSF